MPSITSSDGPRPKLRVTVRCCTPARPHAAQRGLDTVDGDDEEIAVRFGKDTVERFASDDVFNFTALVVALPLDDLAREDDVFEIEDGEVLIFKFLRRMDGHGIV